MDIVVQVHPWEELRALHPDLPTQTLTLPWEERCRSHGKHTTDQGLRFGLSLESGSALTAGTGFLLPQSPHLVEVREAPEALYHIPPESQHDWAYLAYQIGNRHLALMIQPDGLFCLAEPASRLLLEQLQVPFSEVSAPFTPALKFSGHTHSH